MSPHAAREAENWEKVLEGDDRDAFRRLVDPYMDALLQAARRDLRYYVRNGMLHEGDFTPEELVGEGLIHAWDRRTVRPSGMPLRSWLLAAQHRASRGLVRNLRKYRREKGLSLDEPVELNPDDQDKQEWFWEWYQPEQELTWEDVTPSRAPADVEVELDEDRESLLEDVESRHALILHDEFEMSLPDVAFTMGQSPNAIAELLDQARAVLRERLSEDVDERDHPPAGST